MTHAADRHDRFDRTAAEPLPIPWRLDWLAVLSLLPALVGVLAVMLEPGEMPEPARPGRSPVAPLPVAATPAAPADKPLADSARR